MVFVFLFDVKVFVFVVDCVWGVEFLLVLFVVGLGVGLVLVRFVVVVVFVVFVFVVSYFEKLRGS